jgi:protein phosphatase
MKLEIWDNALVVLVGASGSGKSTLARQHFAPTEILSSDAFRAMIADDENDQSASAAAFEALHVVARRRLEAGRLTVIDATNVHPEARAQLLRLASDAHRRCVAVALDLPPALITQRNHARADRQLAPQALKGQIGALRRGLGRLKKEGFDRVWVLKEPEEVQQLQIERVRARLDQRDDAGPFDLIGDVHGCLDELKELLTALGYQEKDDTYIHPEGRRPVFVGDLVDRGPDSAGVLALVMGLVARGGRCVLGNHDEKLLRWLQGRKVTLNHGLDGTVAQLEARGESFKARVCDFLRGLPTHLLLDGGRLVVAHAGLPARLHGGQSDEVKRFALYGEVNGERDEYGLPVRGDWWSREEGAVAVVFGHTPTAQATWRNQTLCLDTGCVFGGALTALRWPERALAQVHARAQHSDPVRPFLPEAPRARGALPDGASLLGGARVQSRHQEAPITINAAQAAAAMEAMSRFAADPRWLIYLPPTMSPAQAAPAGSAWLEHPREVFAAFRGHGVQEVICQEKHMGSRAVVVICRDVEAAAATFGDPSGRLGAVVTRAGRPFFADEALEAALLARLRDAVGAAGLWERLETDWLCLDAELMPWSQKAQALLREQYAPVGAAAQADADAALAALTQAHARGLPVEALLEEAQARAAQIQRYNAAWRRYCWPVEGLAGLKLAPFHLLASRGAVHTDKDHRWHMEALAALCAADPALLRATAWRAVRLDDPEAEAAATAWWEALTGAGGEGMVVKPLSWWTQGPKGWVQPALKCRGREYLRIIYGPEYTSPGHLERLRGRGLGRRRAQAMREFLLGIEGLERFVRGESAARVHECVFGVLALEGEPGDAFL